MPRRSITANTAEAFTFAVDDWTFGYDMYVNTNPALYDLLGHAGETLQVVISGRLLSKTRRRCRAVILTLRPGAVDPKEWKSEWRSFGRVTGVRRGSLMAYARVPSGSLQSVLTALSAGKVRRASISVDEIVRGAGVVTSFTVRPPDEEDESAL
jgi:hypothetical protein